MKMIRGLDIRIAKWLGYRSWSDMDYGSYLTHSHWDPLTWERVDCAPQCGGLHASEEEAWVSDTPHYIVRIVTAVSFVIWMVV